MACVCWYIHGGVLCQPFGLGRRLQLLRVSSELGMVSLHLSVIHSLMRGELSDSALQRIALFARRHELVHLVAAHEDYQRSGRPVGGGEGHRVSAMGLAHGARKNALHGNASDLTGRPGSRHRGERSDETAAHASNSSATLRDAVFASLQEVAAAVGDEYDYGLLPAQRGSELHYRDYSTADRAIHSPPYELSSEPLHYRAPVDGKILTNARTVLDEDDEDRYQQSHLQQYNGGEPRGARDSKKKNHPTTARQTPRGVVGHTSGQKSGGIYGMLLKSDAGGGELLGTTPEKKVPKAQLLTADSKPTPRTVRANTLLAGARRSQVPFGWSADDLNYDSYNAADPLGEEADLEQADAASLAEYMRRLEAEPDSSEGGGGGMPREYSRAMSLAPVKEPTPAQIR